MNGNNGRNGTGPSTKFFNEPAYTRRAVPGNRIESVYVTERRLPEYMDHIRQQVAEARQSYEGGNTDEQGLDTTLFHIYNAAKNNIFSVANLNWNQRRLRERLQELHEIIPEYEFQSERARSTA